MTAIGVTTCPPPEIIEVIAGGGSAPPEIARHLAKCAKCAAAVEAERFANRFAAVLEGKTPPPPVAPEHLPEVFGYEVLGEVSRGGQAVVYRATQLTTGQPVAIKVLHPSAMSSPAARARFAREIEIAGALNHPGIVHPLDSVKLTDGRDALVLEMVDGLSLSGWLNRPTKPTQSEVVGVLAEVAEALHHAHQRGVIHRDLKPSNIIIDDLGRARVLDFGVARWTDVTGITGARSNGRATGGRITLTGEFAGTLAYASPEQVSGDGKRADVRSDTYSLGVIAYEALSARLPYSVDGPLERTISNIMHASPPRPPSAVGADLCAVILKAIAKEPERRYQTAGDLARDLRRAMAGETIEARRDSKMYVLRKAVKRHRFPVTVAALIALAALVVVGVLATSNARLSSELYERTLGELKALTSTGARSRAESILWPLGDATLPAGADPSRLLWSGGLESRRVLWAFAELQAQAQCLGVVPLGDLVVRNARFLEDGRLGLIASDATIWVCDPALAKSHRIVDIAASPPFDGAFTPSGRFAVVAGGGVLRCHDARTGDLVASIPVEDSTFVSVGERTVVLGANQTLTALSLPDLALIGRVEGAAGHKPWLDPSGQKMAWVDRDRAVNLTEISPSMRTLRQQPLSDTGALVGRQYIILEADPACRFAVVALNNMTQVVPLDSDAPAHPLPQGPSYRVAPSVSPDGRLVTLSSSGLSRLRIWRTSDWTELPALPGHDRAVVVHGVSHDGRVLFTIDGANVLRLWAAPGTGWRRSLAPAGVSALDIALSLDGARLYAADAEGSAGVFSTNPDPRLGDPGPLEVLAPRMNTVAAGPGGRVAWADGGEQVFIADTASRAGATPVVVAPGQQVHMVRFSPDGTLIVAGTHRGQLVLASAVGGTIRWTRGAGDQGAGYSGVRFSADGATIAASRRDGTVEFIPIADPDGAVVVKASARMLRGMDLAPDGAHLAAVGNAGELVVVQPSGEVRTSPRLSEDDLLAVAYHPGGATIATGDRAGNVMLVDPVTLSPLATLSAGDAVMALQFDATGRTLFVSTLNRPIERWDLSSLVEPLPRVRPRAEKP